MKRTLLFLAAALFMFSASAQLITISGVNQIPEIEDTIHYTNVNDFGFELAGTGSITDKLWDYSTLTENDNVYFYYVDPAETDDAADFPTATLAEGASGTTGYIYIQAGEYYMARKGITGDMYLNYDTDSALMFQFPITAGGGFTNTYTGIIQASGLDMTIEDGDIEIEADAQGTLITPNGSVFNDVLRIHVTESFSALYDMGTGPMEVMSVEDNYYYWYHEDYKGAIMIYGTTIVESIGGNEESEVLRYQPIELSTKIDNSSKSDLSIYPNPASNVINVLNADSYDGIKIYDITGREIKNINTISNTINVSDLPVGIYSFEFIGENTSEVKKVIIK
ncbi:MAG: T9SS type A sorting domain-containing protein [Bacteroidales bacterium]|nr:T9SS type A sorting domain-containing protein [Bacteroidales bacterium]